RLIWLRGLGLALRALLPVSDQTGGVHPDAGKHVVALQVDRLPGVLEVLRRAAAFQDRRDLVDVFGLPERIADLISPSADPPDREVAQGIDLLDRAEMREQEQRPGAFADPFDAADGERDVELRRRRRGPENAHV